LPLWIGLEESQAEVARSISSVLAEML